MHLLRRDIVDGDDENGLVSLKEGLELFEVGSLSNSFSARHIFEREYSLFKDLELFKILLAIFDRVGMQCCSALLIAKVAKLLQVRDHRGLDGTYN